ncbi:MAG: hypothetical protein ACHQK8_00395 [Bacteroidia bacterium]
MIAVFVFQNHIHAQNILEKDSSNSIRKFQFGIGGYLGTHEFIPHQPLKNLSGYNNGLFIEAIFNFNKKINGSLDIRYFERTGVINFNDGWTPEVFQIKTSGFEIPVTISYKFLNKEKKEIIGFYAGGAYQFVNYETSYDLDLYVLYPGKPTTVPFRHVVYSKSLNNLSAILGLKKDFRLTRKILLQIFNEYDFSLNKFYIEDITNDPITSRNWFGDYHFNSFCIRLGCCVIL